MSCSRIRDRGKERHHILGARRGRDDWRAQRNLQLKEKKYFETTAKNPQTAREIRRKENRQHGGLRRKGTGSSRFGGAKN